MRVLIVEDERIAARRLERLTRDILKESVTDVTCMERLGDCRRFLEGHDIDVLLLDLNLNGEDGFEVLKQATAARFQTVVVSANTDQALRAFEFGVLDFVPKPVERARLERALRRVTGEQRVYMPGAPAAKYLSVRRLGSLYLIPVANVRYLKGAGDYVEIHQRDGAVELHSKSLEALEQILPERFVRVHKSYIVDMTDVKRVLVYGGGRYEIEMGSDLRIPLSRTRYKELQAMLGGRGAREAE